MSKEKMEGLPDKVKRIDILRIERSIEKLCKCLEPSYTIDHRNKLVYCAECGAIVDPYVALVEVANHYDRLERQVNSLLTQAKKIQNWKPHLKVFKDLQQRYKVNNYSMVPVCPHCSKGFDFKDINHWVNRNYCNWEVEKE